MNLCDMSVVRALLEKYNLKPQKGFGQNFLINPEIPQRIAESSIVDKDCYKVNSDFQKGNAVLEIGPGLGTMTRELCENYNKVVAVEIDNGMINVLNETLNDYDNVKVINNDFMKLDLKQFINENFNEEKIKICANLPYYITTPILMKILESFKPSEQPQVESITILVQTEVAERLCAEPGSNEYGSITASLALCGVAKKLFDVSAGNFYPAPKVTSSVVNIKLYENGIKDIFSELPDNPEYIDNLVYFTKKIIAAGFNQRRKTFVNAVSGLSSKENITKALLNNGFDINIRAERLSYLDFLNISKELYDVR